MKFCPNSGAETGEINKLDFFLVNILIMKYN